MYDPYYYPDEWSKIYPRPRPFVDYPLEKMFEPVQYY